VKPFSLAKPSQFRVAPPPALLAIASTNPKVPSNSLTTVGAHCPRHVQRVLSLDVQNRRPSQTVAGQ
jgi:hypothetical protein